MYQANNYFMHKYGLSLQTLRGVDRIDPDTLKIDRTEFDGMCFIDLTRLQAGTKLVICQ